MTTPPLVGVLALQGNVRDHLTALQRCGATAVPVRRPGELDKLDGIVIPGGESTTIDKLAVSFGLREPLVDALRGGLPAFGSCAGMIMLADEILDGRPDQRTFGGLDMTVRRNAFGRQSESFERRIALRLPGQDGVDRTQTFPAVFIRAPWVEECGPGVRVLGRIGAPGDGSGDSPVGGHIVAVENATLLATAFHPEVSGDDHLHRYFLDKLRAGSTAVPEVVNSR